MPTSRFDQNTQQQYQSTYVPLPLEYLSGIAKNMQGEHDKGIKASEDFTKLGQAIKASPVGEGIKQQLIGEMKADMENTYNSTKSYSSPDFQRKVQDLSNKWANDPRITYLKSEKDLFEQNQKDMADKNNSRDLNYTYNKFYNPSNGTYSQAKNINELPLSSRITKYADAYKAQSDIMGNIASSMSGGSKGYDFSHPQSGVGPGGEYYAFNKVTNQVEKIDKNDINRIATASLPLYAKTDAGTFELQKEAQKYIGDKAHGLDYDKLSQLAQGDDGYAALKETIDQKFKQDLTGVGEKQIFTKSKYDVDNMTLGDRQKAGKNDELAQQASTTPEILSLRDNGDLKTVMPEGLAKFYDNGKVSLSNTVQVGSKEAGDRIAASGGWLNLDLMGSGKSNDTQKNTLEYVNALYDNASKILGTSKKDVAKMYGQQKDGYSWLKGVVESHYKDLTLEKNTVATLQAPEQKALTTFAVGNDLLKDQAESGVGSNIKKGEITDLNGNIITNLEGVNSNNYNVSSIGFDKPGQLVLAGNNGQQLLMNTNYESFKKLTKPAVDINTNATNYLKTFELNEDQKSRLGLTGNKSNEAPKFETNIGNQKVSGNAIDWHTYRMNNQNYDVLTFVTRDVTGKPEVYVNYKVENPDGTTENKTLNLDQYKVLTANTLIASPEFRAINNEKPNKVEFNNK